MKKYLLLLVLLFNLLPLAQPQPVHAQDGEWLEKAINVTTATGRKMSDSAIQTQLRPYFRQGWELVRVRQTPDSGLWWAVIRLWVSSYTPPAAETKPKSNTPKTWSFGAMAYWPFKYMGTLGTATGCWYDPSTNIIISCTHRDIKTGKNRMGGAEILPKHWVPDSVLPAKKGR